MPKDFRNAHAWLRGYSDAQQGVRLEPVQVVALFGEDRAREYDRGHTAYQEERP